MGALQQIMLGSGQDVSPALSRSVADSFTLSDGCETFINSPALTKNIADSFTLDDALTTSLHLETLTTSLVAFWKLDEASGTRNDSVGSNHLSDNNTVTQATGKIGNAAQFTAVNSEYLTSTSSEFSTGDIDFTFVLWVYLDTNGTQDILNKVETGTEYACYLAGSRFRFGVSADGTGAVDAEAVADNLGEPAALTWYFLVFWHDATANTLNIQVNNGTVDSTPYSSGVATGTNTFSLGFSGYQGVKYNGRMDAVGFWKRVLTADERTALYNSGNGIEYPF